MASYQPYVEDYNSELSEAVPLTRRQTTKRPSGLSNSVSADTSSYEAEGASVSDSGYSSHAEASTPTETPPPQKAATPAPPSRPQTRSSRSPSNPAPPPLTRPSSKSFSRTQPPSVPRNIPSSYNTIRRELRENSPTTSTGGSEDCDCPNCGKTPSKPVTNSPSRNSGVWSVPEHSYNGSYSSSPSSYATYQYPSKYDGYSEGASAHVPYTEPSREGGSSRRERPSTQSSMPPPPRPLSTFAAPSTTTSSHTPSGSWSQPSYISGYGHTPSPAPAAPTPASTCPPSYSSSMYPPPPLDTSVNSGSTHPAYEYSPYAPPSSSSSSSYTHSYTSDPYSQSPMPPTPNYYQAPEPSYHTAPEYSSIPPPPQIVNRRSSMRAQANAGAAVLESSSDYPRPQVSHHRERRSSNRAHNGERPSSWYNPQQYQDAPSRSISVPPVHEPAAVSSSSRRMAATPQPIRRRDSNNSQGSGSHPSRFPSSLSRSMETCAIDDEPPHRSSRHSHSHHRSSGYYEYHHGALARRDTGTMMQNSHSNRSSDSGSSGYSYDGREELVVLDSDEPFTMVYPAGVPVKVQLNGGNSPRTISLGSRDKNENVEYAIAYKSVQQRQQQVHAQLQHGAAQMDHYDRRTTSSEYPHRSYERHRV